MQFIFYMCINTWFVIRDISEKIAVAVKYLCDNKSV